MLKLQRYYIRAASKMMWRIIARFHVNRTSFKIITDHSLSIQVLCFFCFIWVTSTMISNSNKKGVELNEDFQIRKQLQVEVPTIQPTFWTSFWLIFQLSNSFSIRIILYLLLVVVFSGLSAYTRNLITIWDGIVFFTFVIYFWFVFYQFGSSLILCLSFIFEYPFVLSYYCCYLSYSLSDSFSIRIILFICCC